MQQGWLPRMPAPSFSPPSISRNHSKARRVRLRISEAIHNDRH